MKLLNRNLKVVLPILALVTFAAFFPIKYRTGNTCLADKMISGRAPYPMHHPSASAMRHRYVFPFGLIWWTSAGVIAFLLIGMRHKR